MSDITNETIDKIDAEISAKEAEDTSKFDSAVEKAVADKLAAIEAEKAAQAKKAEEIATGEAKEAELKGKLADMENKQKELQKQLDDVSLRKSIPAEESVPAAPVAFKDLPKEERIEKQREYARKALNMEI